MSRRVVITGLGTVNALGLDVASYWANIKANCSAIRPIEGFDTAPFRSKLGAEVTGFEPSRFIDPMKLRRMDRLSQMVLVSSIEAMKDAGIEVGIMLPERIGVVIGNGYGGTSCTEEFFEGLLLRGPAGVNPMLFPTTVPNSAASLTSIELKIKGPNSTFCQKDISAEEAIIYAAGLIRKGAADVVIAGGGEELNDVIYHAFTSIDILSKNANGFVEGCRPFDRTRNGRVLGEGAAVLILESLESATRRGARIYAELAGSALTGGLSGISGYSKNTATMVRAMGVAIERSGLGKESVVYISAAANSTKDMDASEAMAIKELFGEKAGSIPVSSIRPMTGDFEGMGGLRLLTSVLTIEHGYLPPTLNLTEPDQDLGLDHVTGSGREAQVNAVLHNGFGNGGTNACIVLKKPS